MKKLAIFVDQKPKNRVERPSGPSHSAGPDDEISGAGTPSEPPASDSDLPDIVDLVLEMARAPEEPPADASSPPPPTPADARLPAHLESLAGRARDYVEAASSANTRRTYAADWRHFASWC